MYLINLIAFELYNNKKTLNNVVLSSISKSSSLLLVFIKREKEKKNSLVWNTPDLKMFKMKKYIYFLVLFLIYLVFLIIETQIIRGDEKIQDLNNKDELLICDPIVENRDQFYVEIDGETYPKLVPSYFNRSINFKCLNRTKKVKLNLFQSCLSFNLMKI